MRTSSTSAPQFTKARVSTGGAIAAVGGSLEEEEEVPITAKRMQYKLKARHLKMAGHNDKP